MLKPLTVLDPSKLTPEDCAALRRDGFGIPRLEWSPALSQWMLIDGQGEGFILDSMDVTAVDRIRSRFIGSMAEQIDRDIMASR